jgi:hypothetical protein
MQPTQSVVRLDWGRLPSETLESGSLERGESAHGAEEGASSFLQGDYPDPGGQGLRQ